MLEVTDDQAKLSQVKPETNSPESLSAAAVPSTDASTQVLIAPAEAKHSKLLDWLHRSSMIYPEHLAWLKALGFTHVISLDYIGPDMKTALKAAGIQHLHIQVWDGSNDEGPYFGDLERELLTRQVSEIRQGCPQAKILIHDLEGVARVSEAISILEHEASNL